MAYSDGCEAYFGHSLLKLIIQMVVIFGPRLFKMIEVTVYQNIATRATFAKSIHR